MANFVRDFVETRPSADLAVVTLSASGARREWTFGGIARASAAFAASLQRQGVRRGDTVLLLVGNRIEYVLTLLACLRIGAAALPCSEQLRGADLALRLERATPSAVV
jgi:acyl-coenzyme A synthetase/AMP-(fatty) acid ligase